MNRPDYQSDVFDRHAMEPDQAGSDSTAWGSPGIASFYCLLKKRAALAVSDTPGKIASAQFAEELFSGNAGISLPARNPVPQDAQATEATKRIPYSPLASIAASPAGQQLSTLSQQEKFPATVTLSDSVRGEVGANKNTGLKREEK